MSINSLFLGSFHDNYLMFKCLLRIENNQLCSFRMNYENKEYTVEFKRYYDNSNDFIICETTSTIYANLNRLNQRKQVYPFLSISKI